MCLDDCNSCHKALMASWQHCIQGVVLGFPMAMSAAAAAAARRVTLAQLRSLPSSAQAAPGSAKLLTAPAHHLQARRYCQTPPPPGDKLDKILEMLKTRVSSEVEAKGFQERISKLEAKVYYGGILFGVLAGATLTLPALGYDVKKSFETMKDTQEETERTVADMDARLKVIESAQKNVKVDTSEESTPAQTEESPANPSLLIRVLSHLKVI